MGRMRWMPVVAIAATLSSSACAAKAPGGVLEPPNWEMPSGSSTTPTVPIGAGSPFLPAPPGGSAGAASPAPVASVILPDAAPVRVWTLAGNGLTGLVDGNDAEFRFPQGVAVGPDGTVYVSDEGNYAIRAIAPDGTVRMVAGGTLGRADGTGSAAQFFGPKDLAMGPDGNLYVVDFDVIRRVTLQGVVTTLPITRADGLNYVEIFGVAVDAQDHLALTTLHEVQTVDANLVAHDLAGSSEAGFADGNGLTARFDLPGRLAFDAQGNLIVADFGNSAIRKVTPQGNVTTVAGNGSPGDVDGALAQAMFDFPSGVAIDGKGDILVSDTYDQAIRVIGAGGVRTVAGTGTSGYLDGPGASAEFSVPLGMAMGPNGDLYVADANNQRVRGMSGL